MSEITYEKKFRGLIYDEVETLLIKYGYVKHNETELLKKIFIIFTRLNDKLQLVGQVLTI